MAVYEIRSHKNVRLYMIPPSIKVASKEMELPINTGLRDIKYQ